MNLKTISILLLFLISLSPNLFSQNNDLRLNIGIPLGNYGKFDHSFAGADATNHPSLIIQLEKAWKENLSIGAYIGYTGQKHEYNLGFEEVKYNYYRFGTSLTYELNDWLLEMNLSPGNDIEMYTSIKAGLSLENKKTESSKLDGSSNPVYFSKSSSDLLVDLGILLGTRYHFSNHFGIFSELGWGNAGFFTIGTTFTL